MVKGPKFLPPAWQLLMLSDVCLDPFIGVVWIRGQWTLSSIPILGSPGILGQVTLGLWGWGQRDGWTWSIRLLSWFLCFWGFGTFGGDVVTSRASWGSGSSPRSTAYFSEVGGITGLSSVRPNSETSTISSPSSCIRGPCTSGGPMHPQTGPWEASPTSPCNVERPGLKLEFPPAS